MTTSYIEDMLALSSKAWDSAVGQRNSPFTKSLLRAIQAPDMPIELMFKEVRRMVDEESKSEQVPSDNSSLVGDFVFERNR